MLTMAVQGVTAGLDHKECGGSEGECSLMQHITYAHCKVDAPDRQGHHVKHGPPHDALQMASHIYSLNRTRQRTGQLALDEAQLRSGNKSRKLEA